MKPCPRIIMPVCDNEGITHNNACIFGVRQCVAKETSGRDIKIVHDGVCLEERGIDETLEKCLLICPDVMKPVCDNEGITHHNKCIFQGRQCIAKETSGRDIKIVHDGVCLETTDAPLEQRSIDETLDKCLLICPDVMKPVCDNEGITHNNKCVFQGRQCIAKETSGRDIKIVHNGVCLDTTDAPLL
jgi:hypothetical protein